ncbi:Thiamine biosynthesis lipoprotein ApbE precursor [Maioricimonas rarisocia]|uniref:FAD:protein FMN transferase n=1 Tax=Maioricimonas rarisocia TaxID=2528026 RepID=A0A517Z8V6_9PLAN|nr:FAD:protein FMN transferase [Maioricimonas rarisocia]QDU38871.1 Thiamine biosynthesis lipoprotein ApbE precursor [Maioricimonas rarisocia]
MVGTCRAFSVAICLLLVGQPGLAAAAETLQRFEFLQIRMGIPVSLTVYGADEQVANNAARAAYARLREIDRIMSDYDPDSELMRLCRESRPGHPVTVSGELFHVLSESVALSRRTDGAFDVSIGPVVRLWRQARRKRAMPDPEQLARARESVGFEAICLHPERKTVELRKSGMRLDLGGIAKGYAAEEARRILAEHDLKRVLVDAGGDIVAGDPPPDRPAWTIAIQPLKRKDGETAQILRLANVAVATSGDAYQYVEIDGVRYSHIVDPATGLGLTQSSSVTVIAPDGMTADSLASAVSVLGPKVGLKLIEQTKGIEALIVVAGPDGPVAHESSGFDRYRSRPVTDASR